MGDGKGKLTIDRARIGVEHEEAALRRELPDDLEQRGLTHAACRLYPHGGPTAANGAQQRGLE